MNVLWARYYVLEMACPIILDCVLFLRSRTIGRKIVVQVGQNVALDGEIFGAEGHAGGGLRVGAQRVVDKIIRKGRAADLLLGQVARQLVDDGGDHLQMRQLLAADVGQYADDLVIGHAVALMEVAH